MHGSPWREELRTRLFYRSLDACLTAPLDGPEGSAGQADDRPFWRASNYERLRRCMRLLARLAPRASAGIEGRLWRPERLPFADGRVELVGYGSGATVFRVACPDGPRILKVYRRTLGRSQGALRRALREYRGKYERASRWFGDVVLPSSYVLLHAPLLGTPAVACIQAYVGERRDLLRDHTDEELLAELERRPMLRRRFVAFARATIEQRAREGAVVDFLGEGNLVIAGTGDDARLVLLDYGIFERGGVSPAVERRIQAALARLERLLAALEPAERDARAGVRGGPASDHAGEPLSERGATPGNRTC